MDCLQYAPERKLALKRAVFINYKVNYERGCTWEDNLAFDLRAKSNKFENEPYNGIL